MKAKPLILLSLLILGFAAVYLHPASALPTILRINPDPVEKTYVDYGSYFDVYVEIVDVTDLFGFDINITWNNALITYSKDDYNATFDALWTLGNWQVIKNETGVNAGTGWYKIVALSTSIGYTEDPGSQNLLKLTFRVEGPICNSVRETALYFEVHKLSDSNHLSISHNVDDGLYRITGKTPTLSLNPTDKTCRKYGQTFTIEIKIVDAENVEDLEFEIPYNSTLLDYTSVTWNAWTSGTIDSTTDGVLIGSTSGSTKSGDLTLVTLTFTAAFYRIWKDLPGYVSDQSGKIFIQAANLSYPSAPDLRYIKGGLNEINVGPDVTYTFSPIQGDIENDGDVDIFDLRTVSIFYDQTNATYNLTGDPIVDIFDLVVIARNFGFTYP